MQLALCVDGGPNRITRTHERHGEAIATGRKDIATEALDRAAHDLVVANQC